MISTKKHVQQLAALLHQKGINDVIISPGSRNGPMISTFVGSGLFSCRNVVDERSAAYLAMGLAQALKKPVAIVCSSGTATLNYAPAIAEAYYLNIPLIVITADRPEYWIDQLENQCINQRGIYSNFVKKEYNLPLEESETELWQAAREINECLNTAVSEKPAPVHINVPLEEPLHNLLDAELPAIKAINTKKSALEISEASLKKLASDFNDSNKILILAGQQNADPELEKLLAAFIEKTGAVVLKEHLANLNDKSFCGSIDTLMAAILEDIPADFQPDILITFGGHFVSKSLKQFLRKNKATQHWHLSPANDHYDTYQSLTEVVQTDAKTFFAQLLPEVNEKGTEYLQRWATKENEVNQLRDQYISEIPFSDLKVIAEFGRLIPENSVVHLGNSSPVRYALIAEWAKNTTFFSNRGTSGIDGPLSTAVGYASVSEKINTVLIGDLSFFYDSNALWNNYLGENLRIIVINNGGGNIFSLIKGPGESPAFQQHFYAENKCKAQGIAQTFGLDYLSAENEVELKESLTELYSPTRKTPTILEVFTDAEVNTKTFRGLFKFVKQLQ
ncbi:2-succinyl-5-enolpyruvyl-6-hydroxy-3-cyclohexene-1-carboxylate synthase [Draconibacterium orientale]|uniref:2-succinyl-5-enolpyruvyl-6-hydroxy-3-cyclohexene-1-carboxylate synthase n=1 Tax=Draconibacterium orientale TaxID=1168034 RepID=X5DYY6_9BACT|nr:2-succinyl-5-enolpyruvyl-6-hydroxy-3-cyclohexene-1-carboxylic-acid synthase [Draconibacterium orientale]AHW60440.1 2-succinyl-5-enolpyruvyl-6-hydroxy-3-cyclohexene-1-carboxylate synthase [Draconibacterium orientale]SET98372.1 2-succinyl-5-enolpyruvyl-6-hydroxy-3-cyclohexene-1-carboxylate synthase [Draconibacterium orientale]